MLMLREILWHHAFTILLNRPRNISQPLAFGFPWQGLGLNHTFGSLLWNLAVAHSPTSSPFLLSQVSSMADAGQEAMRALEEGVLLLCVLCIFECQSPGPWAHSISGLLFSWDPGGVSVKLSPAVGPQLAG